MGVYIYIYIYIYVYMYVCIYVCMYVLVGEPDPKFGKVQGRRGTEGLTTDSYVKIPDGSESGLRLWA